MLTHCVTAGKLLFLALFALSLSLCLCLELSGSLFGSHSSSSFLVLAKTLSVILSVLHLGLLLLQVSLVLRLVFFAADFELLLSFAFFFRESLLIFLVPCSCALSGVIKRSYVRIIRCVYGSVLILHFFAHFSSPCQRVYGSLAMCLCQIYFYSL